jgi:hypothetical protein
VLGELVGEDEAHRGLYLAGGGLLVVAGEAGGFSMWLMKEISDDIKNIYSDPGFQIHGLITVMIR